MINNIYIIKIILSQSKLSGSKLEIALFSKFALKNIIYPQIYNSDFPLFGSFLHDAISSFDISSLVIKFLFKKNDQKNDCNYVLFYTFTKQQVYNYNSTIYYTNLKITLKMS